jgi:A/G-specific adenine glycosylase
MDNTCITAGRCAAFRKKIYRYFAGNQRQFSWRKTRDPYHVFVSEVMLQQTQTSRVEEKFPAFMAVFPTVKHLAGAPLNAVLKVWQGMGYNRRVLFLQKAAREIMVRFGGNIPKTVEELESLPGIGPATARSIAVYAYNLPVVFIETNIRTIFIHEFFGGRDGVSDDEIRPLVEKTIDKKNPWKWYNALMDYGVMLKEKHANPGRRSAHYTRQTPFAASDRKIRGQIIKLLTEKSSLTRKKMYDLTGSQPSRVDRCIDGLVKEGFLSCREPGSSYSIKG